MTNQDKLAAATIAKIFGSELLYAQQNARTDGGTTPDFGIVHPKDILRQGQPQTSQHRSERERHMLEMLQREAEASCPLPQDSLNTQQSITKAIQEPVLQTHTVQQSPQLTTITNNVQDIQAFGNSSTSPLEKIASSLERIATCFEKIDFSVKKVRTRRRAQK